uniref:efflux RND transporter permease subunit n=1 Tax=Aminomonas paucivorans TaxID=81412 RepID=UPI0033254FC6
MSLSDASLKRPVAMGCLLIALAFLGVNAYRKMGLELMPKVDAPYISILTVWPGASPTDIEVDVAKKIEDAVSGVDGLKHVISTCMENAVQTSLEFELGTDVNVAADDVREKVDQKLSELPEDVEKPVIQKFNVNAQPVVTLALEGDLPLDELYDYADQSLRDRFSVLAGVADVKLTGGAKREVHVLLDRDLLAAAGLTSLQVEQALREGVRTLPAGRVREGGAEFSVRYDAEFHSVPDIGSLQVVGRDGARRYIRDLGTVRLGTEERRQAVFLDGRPAVAIRVVKKADANTVVVVDKVRATMEALQKTLPGGTKLTWVSDEGDYIRASVDSTVNNIWQGVLLTAGILFLFLYNLRSTFVVAVSMPLTIIIALFFMQLLGYTLNTSTLLAAGLSVGILVSNSLVVLESVLTHLQRTGDPWRAAREGTADVAVAVLASAGTNVVVMLPIGLMGSMVGLFFRPFALTSVVVNGVSIFISFTLTPILAALVLKPVDETQDSRLKRLERRWNQGLDRLADRYVGALRKMLRHKALTLGVLGGVAVLFLHALSLAPGIGFSFAPDIDKGTIYMKLEFPTRQDLETTVGRVQEAQGLLKGLPGLRRVLSTVGVVEGLGENQQGVYLAQIQLNLSDKMDRDEGIARILTELRRRFRSFPDCIVTASIPGLVGGQSSPIDLEIRGDNLKELDRIALGVADRARKTPGFVDLDTSVREGKPEIRVLPRRAVLADLGASPLAVGALLRGNLEGVKAATYKSGAKTYDIRVKLAERPGKDQVQTFQIPTTPGHTVALANFASLEERRSPIQIRRSDKVRVSKVNASLASGLPLGTAVQTLNREIREGDLLPPGYEARFRGEFERMDEATAAFGEAAVLSVLLTFLALSAIMESFKWATLILTTVPLGLVGVLWALALTGTSMSIFVLLGTVMLI